MLIAVCISLYIVRVFFSILEHDLASRIGNFSCSFIRSGENLSLYNIIKLPKNQIFGLLVGTISKLGMQKYNLLWYGAAKTHNGDICFCS